MRLLAFATVFAMGLTSVVANANEGCNAQVLWDAVKVDMRDQLKVVWETDREALARHPELKAISSVEQFQEFLFIKHEDTATYVGSIFVHLYNFMHHSLPGMWPGAGPEECRSSYFMEARAPLSDFTVRLLVEGFIRPGRSLYWFEKTLNEILFKTNVELRGEEPKTGSSDERARFYWTTFATQAAKHLETELPYLADLEQIRSVINRAPIDRSPTPVVDTRCGRNGQPCNAQLEDREIRRRMIDAFAVLRQMEFTLVKLYRDADLQRNADDKKTREFAKAVRKLDWWIGEVKSRYPNANKEEMLDAILHLTKFYRSYIVPEPHLLRYTFNLQYFLEDYFLRAALVQYAKLEPMRVYGDKIVNRRNVPMFENLDGIERVYRAVLPASGNPKVIDAYAANTIEATAFMVIGTSMFTELSPLQLADELVEIYRVEPKILRRPVVRYADGGTSIPMWKTWPTQKTYDFLAYALSSPVGERTPQTPTKLEWPSFFFQGDFIEDGDSERRAIDLLRWD